MHGQSIRIRRKQSRFGHLRSMVRGESRPLIKCFQRKPIGVLHCRRRGWAILQPITLTLAVNLSRVPSRTDTATFGHQALAFGTTHSTVDAV